jgi:glutamate--cysteine ligase catalytic subunit
LLCQVRNEKFFFRQTQGPGRQRYAAQGVSRASLGSLGQAAFGEMSILEILTGKGTFKGLVPMILAYLDLIGTDSHTMGTVGKYLEFIVARASGELLTPAAWMRRFVADHPDYRKDSVISQQIGADLMAACHEVGVGALRVPDLHGTFVIAPVLADDAYAVPLRADALPRRGRGTTASDLITMYQLRTELLARQRKLQTDEAEAQGTLERVQSELRGVESQLGMLGPKSGGGGPTPY